MRPNNVSSAHHILIYFFRSFIFSPTLSYFSWLKNKHNPDTGSGITLNEYEPEHNLSQSDKSSATSESNFDRSSVDSTNRNSFDFPPPPPSSLTSDENMSRYAVHAHKDNNDDISNKLCVYFKINLTYKRMQDN